MKVQNLKNNKIKKITSKSSVFFSDRKEVQNNQIKILLSAEHRNYVGDIVKCFGDLNIKVEAAYVRKSVEELPMQVLIFLTGAVTTGATWDLIKIGIKKIRERFKKAEIRITDKNQNTYNINPKGQINIFLVPNGKVKVISDITTIDDLFKHLQKQNSGRQKIRLGNVIKSNQQSIDKNYSYKTIKYLDTGSITRGKIEGLQAFNLPDAPSRAKRLVKDKNIIYSNVRPIQRHYGFIKNPINNFVVSTGFSVIEVDESQANPFFIYKILTSNDIVKELDTIAEGATTAYPSLKPSDIENLEILLPPLPEQEAIAEMLSSLDDKIELLHKQNKTLENIAQTLFHKWFIEDAKDEWEEKPLDKIADYLNGLACQKYPPKNELDKLPVLKIKELRNGFTENSDWATSEVEDRYVIELGDIIFSWSGSLLLKIWDGQKCVLNQHLFKITSKQCPKWFYYFWTKCYMEKFIGIADSKATTMGHIKREDLSNSVALLPSKNELSKMNKLINPQFEKIISNLESISKLEKLRNTLLSKLMNGAVKVKH